MIELRDVIDAWFTIHQQHYLQQVDLLDPESRPGLLSRVIRRIAFVE
jgi:hypothetical protein